MTNPEKTRRVLGESAPLGGNLAAECMGLISTISAVIIALQTMWACSSDGQSSGFLNRWSGVRVSPGLPFSFNKLALEPYGSWNVQRSTQLATTMSAVGRFGVSGSERKGLLHFPSSTTVLRGLAR